MSRQDRGRRRLVPAALVLLGALAGTWGAGCSSSEPEPRTAEEPAMAAPAEDGRDLGPSRSPGEAESLAAEARSDLEATEAILGRLGDDGDDETAAVVRNLVEQARAALAEEDFERARNLAHKARTLAEDL